MKAPAILFLCACALASPLAAAQRSANPPAPFQVADLNRVASAAGDAFIVESPYPYFPHNAAPAAIGNVLYFAAADPGHGRELWRTDGTAAGTWRVSDVRPGPEGSDPRNLTVHEGRLFFTADDGAWGTELWLSDGTAAGTRLVADACPGPCSSLPERMVSTPGRLFFTVSKDRGRYTTLWSTDGTRAGTREIPAALNVQQIAPLPKGGALFTAGTEPWRTDGTPEGTFKLQLPGTFFGLTGFTGFDQGALFWSTTGDLWRTDGTVAGSVIVRKSGPVPRTPPVVQDGAVFFAASVGFTNPQAEVWVARGTPLRTFRLGVFKIGQDVGVPAFTASPCGPLFLARNAADEVRIWRIASASGPIEPVTSPLAKASGVLALWSARDRAFYVLQEPGGLGLWEVDGTSCQPQRVTDVGTPSIPAGAGALGFFVTSTPAQGNELWRSDGTAAGTFLVKDIGFDPGSGSSAEMAALGSRALFPGRTSQGPPTLWTTDGTAAGTKPVRGVPWTQGLLRVGNSVFFSGGAQESDPFSAGTILVPRGLWRTDGTRVGTQLIAPNAYSFQGLGTAGNRLLFSASDAALYTQGTGVEPWISDGTATGTHRVMDVNSVVYDPCCLQPAYPGSSEPGPAAVLGASFVFAADDGSAGREPWISDGTAPGTRRLLDVNLHLDPDGIAQTAGSDPRFFTALGSLVLFAADDAVTGRELWATDGTPAGTRRVSDLAPGAAGSAPHDLVPFGGRVWFLADDGNGQALWSTDGTAAGTVRVAALAYQGRPSWARSMIAAGTRLFFVVDNDALGSELWTSDGTAAGTKPVADLRPGPQGSYPQALTVVGSRIVFAADDGTTGLEPWTTDGTAVGTRRLGDLAPGPDASTPLAFTAAGSTLFFTAWDAARGREVWAVPLAGLKR